MSTTPGQAAYEAHRDELGGNRPWSDVREPERQVWEATAQAAIKAARFRLTDDGHQIVRFGKYSYLWTGDEPLELGDVCLLPGNWLFRDPQEGTVTGFGTDYDGALSRVIRLVRKAEPVP